MNRLRISKCLIAACVVIISMISAAHCYAKVIKIYVAVNGSDQSSGTSADKPLQTLQAAINALPKISIANGDSIVVLLSAGTYYIDKAIAINQILPFNNPLTIMKSGSGDVKISGFKKIANNKIKLKGKYWEIDIAGSEEFISQLKINNNVAAQAVYPTDNFLKLDSVSQKILKKAPNPNVISDSALQVLFVDPAISAKLKDELSACAEIEIFNKWHFIRKPVRENNNGRIFIIGYEMSKLALWKPGTRFRVANSSLGLNPGNWVFNKNTKKIYYYPVSNDNIQTSGVFVPATQSLFTINGANAAKTINNIYIRGISFEGAGYNIYDKGMDPMQAAATYGAVVEVNNASNINFSNCAFTDISLNGIWLKESVFNSSIDKCYFNKLGIGGIKVGEAKPSGIGVKLPNTSGNTISNCIIQNGGLLNAAGVGVTIFQSGNNKVINNEISDFYYSGMSVGFTWGAAKSYAVNNLIANNYIHHIGKGVLDDMGGIYMLGTSTGSVIRDNIIDHVYSYDYGGWGIYLDQGSAGIKISGNLALNTKSGGYFQIGTTKQIEVSGNIFANSDIHQVQMSAGSATPTTDTVLFFHDNYIIKRTGNWFYGSWNGKGIYLRDNTFGFVKGQKDQSSPYLVQFLAANSRTKFTEYNDLSILDKDVYTGNDIKTILSYLGIKRNYNTGPRGNQWSAKTNENTGGYYSGFNNSMRKKTLFRANQVGL
jgi:hypothetical protein